jgi:phage terminase small subunit
MFVAHRVAHPTAPAAEAAIHAGYSKHSADKAASRLLADPRIRDRIRMLTGKAAQQAGLSLQSHLEELARLRDRAALSEQFGPAVTAEVSRGKVSGLYEEKVRIVGDTLKGMTNEQLVQLAHLLEESDND